MIVGELSKRELIARLHHAGLRIRTGPVVNAIQSRFPEISEGLALHYADHPLEDPGGFTDFSVRVALPRSLRRWVRPQAFFYFDGVAPFLPLPASQAFAMLEWGLNWCVTNHCHQYLIVHAAAVEKSGCAMLLPGAPGSGKSTLCAGLVSRGWRLLSDELVLLEQGTGRVVPLARPISLKNESIAVIGRFAPDARLNSPVHDTVKGSVAHMKPPADSVRSASQSACPRWIVQPHYESGTSAQLTPTSKARTFMYLADHAFNYDVHGRRGFELLAHVVSDTDCFEFKYGALESAVPVLDELASRP